MSGYSTHEPEDFLLPRHRETPIVLRGIWVLWWGVVSFALNFAEAVAEELAPLLLLLGGLWWGIPRLLAGLPLDGQVKDLLRYIPDQLQAGGYTISAIGMLKAGILLLAVVAACRTVNGIIARRT
jgi:hypothetical protein